MGLNDKVWPDFDLGRRSNEGTVCAIERSYPKVGVGQILKWYFEYFSNYEHFSKIKRRTPTWV